MKDRGSVLWLPLLNDSCKAVPGPSPLAFCSFICTPPSTNFEVVLINSVEHLSYTLVSTSTTKSEKLYPKELQETTRFHSKIQFSILLAPTLTMRQKSPIVCGRGPCVKINALS